MAAVEVEVVAVDGADDNFDDGVDDAVECGFFSILAHVLKSEQTRQGFLGCFESCEEGSWDGAPVKVGVAGVDDDGGDTDGAIILITEF